MGNDYLMISNWWKIYGLWTMIAFMRCIVGLEIQDPWLPSQTNPWLTMPHTYSEHCNRIYIMRHRAWMYYCISYPSEKEIIFSVINNYFTISRKLLVSSKLKAKKAKFQVKKLYENLPALQWLRNYATNTKKFWLRPYILIFISDFFCDVD